MRHHISALVWQCTITYPHIFERSDSILPLSRYIMTCIDSYKIYHRVLNGIELQRLDTTFRHRVIVTYYLNYNSYIRIVYFRDDSYCHAMLIEIRIDDKYSGYTIHWNGKIYSRHLKVRYYDTPYKCGSDCERKTAKPRLDAFVKEFLRFRRIRIRKSET